MVKVIALIFFVIWQTLLPPAPASLFIVLLEMSLRIFRCSLPHVALPNILPSTVPRQDQSTFACKLRLHQEYSCFPVTRTIILKCNTGKFWVANSWMIRDSVVDLIHWIHQEIINSQGMIQPWLELIQSDDAQSHKANNNNNSKLHNKLLKIYNLFTVL